ncbi:MAG: branched-chain-amino-acid transaminase [Chloroflexi bacterium RBG_13_51_36]|nr:MAG: branched-chain-amino-acid transaminase [Chloroflexi bacterium RBG_13_51_36]
MPDYAFFHKQFVPLPEAKIGVLTHALHYGTACFEGIRGNWDSKEKRFCIFRIQHHYERMLDGCRILKMNLPYTVDKLCQLTREVVERSGYQEDVYIRPLAYKSSEVVGVRLHNLEDDFCIIVTTLPPYLDAENGVRCCTSSWRRVDDTMIPPRGKICGIYVNSALAKTEAWENGFDEAILLTQDGHVSEGSGENIFLLLGGKLITPPSSDNILMGITRDTVMKLARNELGTDTIERPVDRSELYVAEECFFTGTAANVAPVLEIDHRPIGTGKIGEMTAKLQKLFAEVMLGRNSKYPEWYYLVSPKPVKA